VEIHDLNLDWGSPEDTIANARMLCDARTIEFWGANVAKYPDEHLATIIAHELCHVYLRATEAEEQDQEAEGNPRTCDSEQEELKVIELLKSLGFDQDAMRAWEWSVPPTYVDRKMQGNYAPGLVPLLREDSPNIFRTHGIVDNRVFTRAANSVIFPLLAFFSIVFQLDMRFSSIKKLSSETMKFIMTKLSTEHGCKLKRRVDSGTIQDSWNPPSMEMLIENLERMTNLRDLMYPPFLMDETLT
jgi:hypothetical protein